MALAFYYKGKLEKVTIQRTQLLSAFSFLLKEPSKETSNYTIMQYMHIKSKNCNQMREAFSEIRVFLENHS